MNKENVEQIEELLDDSLETLSDKKRFSKTMNSLIKDCSKKIGIEPKILKAVKNYHHYQGANWVDNKPLEKDSSKKEKDKISPVFIKLKEIVDNLRQLNDVEFLKPYLKAMDNCGIHITIDSDDDLEFDKEYVNEVIESTSKLQTNVDTLSEELKETKSNEAEKLNFTPKSSFIGVLGILDKIKDGKNQEDKIQDNFTTITMLNNAFTYLSAKNDEYKESD